MVRVRMIEAGERSPQLGRPRLGRPVVAGTDLEPPRARRCVVVFGSAKASTIDAADVDQRAAALVGKGLHAVAPGSPRAPPP